MLGKHLNHCEDSLTAAILSHLLHLPTELWWQILRNASYTDSLPIHPGELTKIEYWPKWDATNTGNTSYVEPDLFFQFPDFDLIVEAKRWDHEMQSYQQWEREVIAYANEYLNEDREREFRLLALGGLRNTVDDLIEVDCTLFDEGRRDQGTAVTLSCPVHKCRWRSILDECLTMRSEYEQLVFRSSATNSHLRTLSDVIALFASHGFQTGVWYADVMEAVAELSSRTEKSVEVFRFLQTQVSNQ